MRRKDWADWLAEELFDRVRNAEPDEKVIDAIAKALRDARRGDKGKGKPAWLRDLEKHL